MATNLSQEVADLARRVALDQIEQDIKNNETFAKKSEVGSSTQNTARLLSLEAKVSELIQKIWTQEKVEPLSLAVVSETDNDAFRVRLTALEEKVEELRTKTWKQTALD